MLTQLRSLYEKRRKILQNILSNDTKLERSRKDQIRGAVSEIDALLKTINDLREQEVSDSQRIDNKGMGIENSHTRINLVQKIGEQLKTNFNDSHTKDNLINLFVRKCETAVKYELYSNAAQSEGLDDIARIFKEYSKQEKEHAKTIFKQLGWAKKTYDNVKEAADIEQFYHSHLISEFEKIALDEKFSEIASLLRDLMQIEAEHEKTFLKLLKKFHDKKMFHHDATASWKCMNCGHHAEGKEPPRQCPICKKPQTAYTMVSE